MRASRRKLGPTAPLQASPRAERGTSVALGPGTNKDLQPQRGATIFVMPQSLARVVLHLAFSTKNRSSFLKDADFRARLHAYIAGVLQNIGCEPILIGGMEDYVHILSNLSHYHGCRTRRGGEERSSKWIKEQDRQYRDFFWQSGYAAFSVSESQVEKVRAYIAAQEQHHRKVSFQDEFRSLCRKRRIEINERYVWD